MKKILICCLWLLVLSCEKYYQEDLITLEEVSALALEYYNGDLTQDYIITYFEANGYKCYFNDNYDQFYIDNLMTNTRSIVYEKSKDMAEGEILNKMILVAKNSKVFEVSISIDTTKDSNSKILTSTSLTEIQVFDMQEYDMTKYDSVYDIGR